MKRELKETVESIAYGLKPEFDRLGEHRERVKRGPSKWLEIHDDQNQYREFDYQILDGDVFMPNSPAAQHWAWYVLPEGLDAYTNADGYVGYVIPNGLEVLLDAANRDGLVSYEERMHLEEERNNEDCTV